MSIQIPRNIYKSQEDYLELLTQYKNIFDNKQINFVKAAMIIDDLKCFWLERLRILEFEIEELTEKKSCFLLSGAIYLNVANFDHYYFKSLGDYHLMYDPILKMENFFRVDESQIETKEIIDYLIKVYYDTMNILTNYKSHFLILPIREIAIEDEEKHQDMIDRIFLNLISSLFDFEIKTKEEFWIKFQSFEEIEASMHSNIRSHFVFSNHDSPNLSLREKMENYIKSQMGFSALIQEKSEAQIFLISINSWIMQILDTILVCTGLRLNPYIRYDITFHYLLLIMYNFLEDKALTEMIERTIIFYILRKTISVERFKNIDFSEYCKRVENVNLLPKIINRINENGINIFQGGFKQIEAIIFDEFNRVF